MNIEVRMNSDPCWEPGPCPLDDACARSPVCMELSLAAVSVEASLSESVKSTSCLAVGFAVVLLFCC